MIRGEFMAEMTADVGARQTPQTQFFFWMTVGMAAVIFGGFGLSYFIPMAKGELPPFPTDILSPDTVCYDLSYSMRDTPFVVQPAGKPIAGVSRPPGAIGPEAISVSYRALVAKAVVRSMPEQVPL